MNENPLNQNMEQTPSVQPDAAQRVESPAKPPVMAPAQPLQPMPYPSVPYGYVPYAPVQQPPVTYVPMQSPMPPVQRPQAPYTPAPSGYVFYAPTVPRQAPPAMPTPLAPKQPAAPTQEVELPEEPVSEATLPEVPEIELLEENLTEEPLTDAPLPDDVAEEASPKAAPAPKKKQKAKKAKKSGGLGWKVALIALCFALLGSAVGGAMVGFYFKNQKDDVKESEEQLLATQTDPSESELPTTQPSVTPPPTGGVNATTLTQLYDDAVPSIVGITNEFTTYNYFGQASTAGATGTGFVISADGEILTNYHVVENAEKLTVTMYDGKEYSAKVLGYEAESDVALLKINAQDLTPVKLGDSDALKVGDQIAAIGNPLGELTYTMTVGYVSAKSRAVYTDDMPINMMQIDAAINSGNSGGPLFNLNGEVIGITTAKYSGSMGGSANIEGIGFAIPINDVAFIVDDLREYGYVKNRAQIGVTVSNSVAAGDIPAGALVQSVNRGSSGDKAGLLVSDIIVAVGDTKVYGIDTLYQALRPYRGGDTVEMTVFRSGQTLTLTITFDAQTTDDEPVEEEPTEEGYGFPWEEMFP